MADEIVQPVLDTAQPVTEPVKAPETVTEPTPKAEPAGKPEIDSIPRHRFNEVYRQKKELERQLAEATKPKETPIQAPSPPKLEDYGDDVAAFNRAFVQHEAQGIAKREIDNYKKAQDTERQTASLNQRRDAAAANWAVKSLDASTRNPDFHQALELAEMSGIAFPPQISLLIAESEKAGDLAYYLAKNHEVSNRLLSLPYDKAILELGRIDSTLSPGNGKPAPKITKAPAPPEPVSGEGNSQNDLASLSQVEYNKRRNAQYR